MSKSSGVTVVTDVEVIEAGLGGDIACFGTTVGRYWNMVITLAMSVVTDTAEAEDFAQEAFIKVCSRLSILQNLLCFTRCLSRITLQQYISAFRCRTNRVQFLGCKAISLDQLNKRLAQTRNLGLTQDQIDHIKQVVRRLPGKSMILIIMKFVAGLSAVHILKQLTRHLRTVGTRLYNAYEMLCGDLTTILEEVRQS